MKMDFHQLAVDCVSAMGDVFWDYVPERDQALEFRNPFDVAVECVEETLKGIAHTLAATDALSVRRAEYETLISELPQPASDDLIVGTLIVNADWTKRGAEAILRLSQLYGSFVLLHALALANALDIEDGESGL